MRIIHENYCCGLQIRPVEEQFKQRVIGKRYCISRKGSHTKEVLAVLGLQSVCQMSSKEREVVSFYFLLITGRHKALSFWGKGKGAVLH